ncbi:4941_t:CDS:2 [Dentiscutata erythropus]|uniref:4941_t:CDS:1 n=1 Tax=Dentiscutata erythropus TaxID=1348616 RepID=A0A9N9E560_9GLOM|nr:4941_t:CDS:2 [Dentiscutata erythropus]
MIFGINCFTPEGRSGHVAVIVNNQIYFMGGSRLIPDGNPIKSSIRKYNLSNEVFSLDLTSQFSTINPSYVKLPDSQMAYGSEKGTAVVGGPSKEDVYLVGSTLQNLTLLNQIDNNATITSNQTLMINELINTWNVTNQPIFVYRPSVQSWFSPDSQGGPMIRRRSTSTVIDQNGRIIYMFGGRAQIETGSLTLICFNDLYTYDTTVSKWSQINAANAPSPRSNSPAILLQNGKILYIGGVYQISPGEATLPIDMNNIAKSSIPIQARAGHTATLTPDNKTIIIIGGTSSNITNNETSSNETNPYIYLLDLPCKSWVTIFKPGESSCPKPSVNVNNVFDNPIYKGLIISGIVLIVF